MSHRISSDAVDLLAMSAMSYINECEGVSIEARASDAFARLQHSFQVRKPLPNDMSIDSRRSTSSSIPPLMTF